MLNSTAIPSTTYNPAIHVVTVVYERITGENGFDSVAFHRHEDANVYYADCRAMIGETGRDLRGGAIIRVEYERRAAGDWDFDIV